ncbi:hypothetical protein I8752_35060 [Nostocaceae cyanobacterium CENA369]|uniref:Uncharacterized protein n=1 Tax=Dendronalium phyllosphericum CENA369 TaxID=1725256 RepID=A0A8J7ILV1_9NOST|nr:hypothetical protein [Dendronalium phyllosphericum]MBH8578076.1 hypothetical protein [Dendronalium phyllosphericum CENA369]
MQRKLRIWFDFNPLTGAYSTGDRIETFNYQSPCGVIGFGNQEREMSASSNGITRTEC